MSGDQTILLIEIGNTKDIRFHNIFLDETKAAGIDVTHVISAEALSSLVTSKSTPSAIVFNWNYNTTPHVLLEHICQNPVLSAAPLVLFASECSSADVAFWQEYRIPYIVRESTNTARDVKEILRYLAEDREAKTQLANHARDFRFFFNALQSENLDRAEIFLEKIKKYASNMDFWYFKAHLLKNRKLFKDALSLLSNALKLSHEEKRSLEPRYLHLVGTTYFKAKNIEKAAQFLRAAHRISPHNPRRKLILGQVSARIGDFLQAKELYLDLYNQSKEYDAVYLPLIELLIEHAYEPSNLNLLPDLLSRLSERKLTSICKRLRLGSHRMYESLIDIFKHEFYRHAKNLILKDDFYGAVGIYQTVRNLISQSDTTRRFEVTLNVIETLIESGDVKLARKHLEKIQKSSSSIRNDALTKRYHFLEEELKSAA